MELQAYLNEVSLRGTGPNGGIGRVRKTSIKFIVLYCNVMYCNTLHCIAFIALHIIIALHCIVLYFMVSNIFK